MENSEDDQDQDEPPPERQNSRYKQKIFSLKNTLTLIGIISFLIAIILISVEDKAIFDDGYPYWQCMAGIIVATLISSIYYHSKSTIECAKPLMFRSVITMCIMIGLCLITSNMEKYRNVKVIVPLEFILLFVTYVCYSLLMLI